MDHTKLAIVLTATPEDRPEDLQKTLESIREFWAAGLKPFASMELLTPEGLEDAPLPEQKNFCLALAAQNNAGWCLILNPGDVLHLKDTEDIEECFAARQGIWGIISSHKPDDTFSIKLPQILELEDYQELLYFDPLMTLSTPYFVRTDAALETGFSSDYPLGHDLHFAIRFWARWNALKTAVLIGGSQHGDNWADENLREEYGEIILAARQEVGLGRETPEIVEAINVKTRGLQAYCRGKQAISENYLPELRKLMPYRGLLDVTISPHHGFMLTTNNDDCIAEQLAWRGKYKELKTSVWTVLAAQNPGIIFDCGAYNGFFGLVAATVCPQSQVYCFEPEREAFTRVVENIRNNNMRNMQVLQYALDVAPGLATLYRLEEDDGLCLRASIHPEEPCPIQDGQPVNVINLDSFLLGISSHSEEAPVTLVKMDLCGQESQALQGMLNTLYEQRPTLLLTVYPQTNTRKIEQLLLENDYALYLLDQRNGLISAFEAFPTDLQHEADILASTMDQEQLAAQLETLQEE